MLRAAGCLAVCALVCASLSSCGGGTSSSSSGGSGGGATSSSTEYLYSVAADQFEVYQVNTSSGKLSLVQNLPIGQSGGGGANTTFQQGNNQYFFTASSNGISAFSIGSDGKLSALSNSPFPIPQSLLFQPDIGSLIPGSDGTHLYGLDGSGSILVMSVGSTGAITCDSLIRPPSIQAGSGYGAVLGPSGRSIYYMANGIFEYSQQGDEYSAILGYSVDPSTGTPTAMPAPGALLPPNSLPEFMINDPTGQLYYVGLSGSGSIAAFSRDSTTGAFTEAAGSPYTVGGAGAEITGLAMHPSGKYLYTVDLWNGTILGYSINSSTGALTPLPGSPFPAQTLSSDDVITQGPLAVDPSGNLLLVSTTGNYTAVYKINQNSGVLSAAGSPQSTAGGLETFNFLTVN